MSIASMFGFKTVTQVNQSTTEMPALYPLAMKSVAFVDTDVMTVYSKILTDCVDRTFGLSDKLKPLLSDNVLKSETNDGLITLLAKAMSNKQELFLVYIKSLNLLRQATGDEETKITEDYLAGRESKLPGGGVAVYVSFVNYSRTDMVKLYSTMEYCVVSSLNKLVNLSNAVQVKMNDLRASVSLMDAGIPIAQAVAIAQALAEGRSVLLDKNDEIVTSTPDVSSVQSAIGFLDAKKCFYYGLPLSYVNGEQTGGIGSTGEADTKAVERGLRPYFNSILKPVCDQLFGSNVSFKSNDFRTITAGLEVAKTFELMSDDLITLDMKRAIISQMFDIAKKDQPKGEPVPVLSQPVVRSQLDESAQSGN